MSARVKVCGVTRVDDARAAVALGAALLGLNFYPRSPRNLALDAALEIADAVRGQVKLVGVFVNSTAEEVEAQAARLGIADSVRFVGFQSDPRPYLALMDAFVLPVPVGPMSIGLLEAMAMRRAVVITFGGEGEAVVHGQSGFCAEPRSPESISRYVTQILQDTSLRDRLGNAAYQRIADTFSAQQVARSLGQLYRSAGR